MAMVVAADDSKILSPPCPLDSIPGNTPFSWLTLATWTPLHMQDFLSHLFVHRVSGTQLAALSGVIGNSRRCDSIPVLRTSTSRQGTLRHSQHGATTRRD